MTQKTETKERTPMNRTIKTLDEPLKKFILDGMPKGSA